MAIKRVRIFFINCPTLDVEAASYLVLSQNKIQSSIQFEVYHFWIYGLESYRKTRKRGFRLWIADNEDLFNRFFWWLGSRRIVRKNRAKLDLETAPHFSEMLDLRECFGQTEAVIDAYDEWVSHGRGRGANNIDTSPSPAIVITEARFPNNYISHFSNDRRLGIVSLRGWKNYFKPGSALEYILVSTQKIAIAISLSKTIRFHFPTRGCLFDYTQYIADTRIGAFLGNLCETCDSDLKSDLSSGEYEEITNLVGNSWIGVRDAPNSVANILSRIYKYDLSRSTGLRPRLKDEVIRSFQSELGRALWGVGKWLLIALTLLLAAFFPWIQKFITGL